LPPVAIHDLAIQQEQRDLLVGTHGRSIYKIQLEPVYQSATYLDSGFLFLKMDPLKYSENWGTLSYEWKETAPRKEVVFYLSERSNVTIAITDEKGNLLLEKDINGTKGFNTHSIELKFQENPSNELEKGDLGKYYPVRGKYIISVNNGSQTLENSLMIQ